MQEWRVKLIIGWFYFYNLLIMVGGWNCFFMELRELDFYLFETSCAD